ncbi:class I SAM-dependent methyltransferase [Bacteroidota bacterium]
MENIHYFINKLIEKGGQEPHEYEKLNQVINLVKEEKIEEFRNILKPTLNENTIHGWGFLKPYGYSGDHIMIEKIYNGYVSSDNKFKKWDLFFHSHSAPKAVRNRKRYFLSILDKMDAEKKRQIFILGCGPATEVNEYFDKHPESQFSFDLIDACDHAIQYASQKLENYHDKLNFIHANIVRVQLQEKYDLVWSAGVFDYIKDKHFVRFLKKFYECLHTDGKMIIGNFSFNNISRQYMEKVGNWHLQYRSMKDLQSLAVEAGIKRQNIEINFENLGINLFMHLKK